MVEFTSPAAARLFFANCPSSGRDRLAVAEHGFSLRYTDQAAMLAWCEAAAVNLPSTLPAADAGLLLAHLGNAHRVACNFPEAEVHLRQALEALPSEPLILEFYSDLLKDTGQLFQASSYLKRAGRARRGAGDSPGLAKTLLNYSIVLIDSGLPGQAAESTLNAFEMIGLLPHSSERERLARISLLNFAKCLVDAGEPQKALWVLRLCRERLLEAGEFMRLRVDWLTADISGALGDLGNAVAAYREVRERYAELGQLRESALVTLDLARLLLRPRPREAREEALRIWPILDRLGIPPDSREAKLLAEVVEKGSEVALIELAAALRALARATGALLPTLPTLPGTL